jgi:toluene monooxygenase system protein D
VTARIGPILEANDVGRAIIAAIREQHPDVEVQDRGSYLRVLVEGRCVITRQAVERILGRPFRLPSDLEMIMPSFQGTFSVTEDEAAWASRAMP